MADSDSKLLGFELLDYSNLFFQIPGFPGGLEFKLVLCNQSQVCSLFGSCLVYIIVIALSSFNLITIRLQVLIKYEINQRIFDCRLSEVDLIVIHSPKTLNFD